MSNPFNRTYSQDTTITRRTKQEAEMAINDLLKRGYEIVLPLTEKKSMRTSTSNYNYRRNRYESVDTSLASCWIAKLRRPTTCNI